MVVSTFGTIVLLSSLSVNADCTDAPCPHPPCCNGDVNGDGSIDISDAIYLLSRLFTGGPPPVDIECVDESARLPATGQPVCYDTVGFEIDCNDPDWPGQDGFYRQGFPMTDRFVDNGDGTVTDKFTRLMWQQATADINDDGRIREPGFGDDLTWQVALQYCENLVLCEDGTWTTDPVEAEDHEAKYSDWRLPNVLELVSIADFGQPGPALSLEFSAIDEYYWSSTTCGGNPSRAWGVWYGHADHGEKSLAFGYVRAVRSVSGDE
jgi:hypothetical protein